MQHPAFQTWVYPEDVPLQTLELYWIPGSGNVQHFGREARLQVLNAQRTRRKKSFPSRKGAKLKISRGYRIERKTRREAGMCTVALWIQTGHIDDPCWKRAIARHCVAQAHFTTFKVLSIQNVSIFNAWRLRHLRPIRGRQRSSVLRWHLLQPQMPKQQVFRIPLSISVRFSLHTRAPTGEPSSQH